MGDQSFVCATCGQTHEGLPLDYAFRLPDEVHALHYIDRYRRSRSNADLCTMDESRYFFRGVIPVPFKDSGEEFCWGVWVEVSRENHELYASGFHDDLSEVPRFIGHLANDIPGYDGTIGLVVEVQLMSGNDRPSFYFPNTVLHALADEQRNGISSERHHDILDGVGHFKDKK